MSIPDSQIHTFISLDSLHSMHLLEGDKIIADLAVLHQTGPNILPFFRGLVLSSRLLCCHMKGPELVGVYFDGTSPAFNLKVETGSDKPIRAMVSASELSQPCLQPSGTLRMFRMVLGRSEPYNTVVQINGQDAASLANTLIEQSYQMKARIIISEKTDRAFMLSRLPMTNREKLEGKNDEPFESYCEKMVELLEPIIDQEDLSPSSFADAGFKHLISKPVTLGCDCSMERALTSIAMLDEASRKEEFAESDPLPLTCDYCKTTYNITQAEVEKFLLLIN